MLLVSGLEKIEAECEVSGVIKILLKAYHMPQSVSVYTRHSLILALVLLHPHVGQLPLEPHLLGHPAVVLGRLDCKEMSYR